MDLSLTEEQDALVQTAREFTRKEIVPKAGHFDETGEFPRELFKRAWETGLMNVEIPADYAGSPWWSARWRDRPLAPRGHRSRACRCRRCGRWSTRASASPRG